MPEDVKELFDGDAKKFVNDILVGRQHYLQRVRVQGPDPEVEAYEYSWGERANLEVKKSDILKMVVELYDCEPRMFKEQFDKVRNQCTNFLCWFNFCVYCVHFRHETF